MLKILWARLQQYVNCELPDVQAGFRQGRGSRDQIANICWIIRKAREFQKNIYFCFINYAKPLCGSQQAVKNSKRWCYESATLKMPANLEKSAVATGLEKVRFHSSSKERQCQRILKLPTIELISHASKVMLKILQVRLQHYVNHEIPDV